MISVSTGGTMLDSDVPTAPGLARNTGSVESATVQALQEVVSVLQEMKAENDSLREQLMETNRELNGMQIQLDGYDNSFRPLRLQPTHEGVIDSGNPLLPPKRW